MKFPFYKMSGSGNDFVIIDNRKGILEGVELPQWVQKVCRRGLSVGADGLILVQNSSRAQLNNILKNRHWYIFILNGFGWVFYLFSFHILIFL